MPTKTKDKDNYNLATATTPNSVEAEQQLLCSIMRNTSMQLEIISQLGVEDFYQESHRHIFKAMVDISVANLTVDFTTVIDELRRNGKLAQVGDIEYINRLWDLLPSTARYSEYVDIVKRASIMRKLIAICGDVTKKAYSNQSTEEVIAYAEEKLFELAQKGTTGGLNSLAMIASKTLADIQARYINPDEFKGTPTGFETFDRLTNGLHGGELIIIAARPGIGKSALAMNMVENISKSGRTVAIFSLEMSNQQLVERMLSSMGAVPLSDIKSGNLSNGQSDLERLRNAYNIIVQKMHVFGNDTANIRPAEIRSQCRRLKQTSGLDLVVIDYIGLMKGDSDSRSSQENRQTEIASITRGLKIMAKELDVPVIALSQLKREAETRNVGNKDKGSIDPVLSDLRDSGAIEQDADIVMFIHREKIEGAEDKVKLIVAKHRNGETKEIPLRWVGSQVRFVDAFSNVYAKTDTVANQVNEVEDTSVMMTDSGQEDSFFIEEE